MYDPHTPVEEVRRSLQLGSRPFQRAQAALGPASGEDGTGAITVNLDANGVLASVRVTTTWRQQLGGQGLSSAVHEAWMAAVSHRNSVYSAAFEEAVDDETTVAPPQEPASSDRVADLLAHLRESPESVSPPRCSPPRATRPIGRNS